MHRAQRNRKRKGSGLNPLAPRGEEGLAWCGLGIGGWSIFAEDGPCNPSMNVVPCWLGIASKCFRIVLPLSLAVAVAVWIWWPAGLVLGALPLFLLTVHRCPDVRCTRIPGAIGAPCDGKVASGENPDSRSRHIRIKPTGFDCRILRAPISGRVTATKNIPNGQLVELEGDQITCQVRVEGGVRLFGWPTPLQKGTDLDAGEAIGLVPLGGRISLEFPDCATLKVLDGQKVQGGQTVVAIAFEEDLRKGRLISRSDSDLVSLAETG